MTSSKCCFHEKINIKLELLWSVEFLERETPQFISPLLWPPNLPDLNPVAYSVWSILQPAKEGVQNTHH